MKKCAVLFALLLSALLLALCACGGDGNTGETETAGAPAPETEETPSEGIVGIANPWVEYDTEKELEEATGIPLKTPAGARNVRYSAMNGTLAQMDFEIDGVEYTLRASYDDQDFSGLYGTVGTIHSVDGVQGAQYVELFSGDEVYRKIEYCLGTEINYVLMNVSGADEAAITELFKSLELK